MGRAGIALKKEEVLVDSESQRQGALLSWIEQFAPYGVVTLDEALCVQSWNHWMEEHSGMKAGEVAGKSLFELFPELRERKLVAHFERALAGESSVLSTALHRYLLPLKSPFHEPGLIHMLQTARIAPLFSDAAICGVVLVIEDVTQRERQAETLARQHRRDEILSWALAHLLKTDEPRNAVRQLFFKIAEHLDFDTFLVYLRDVETGRISLDSTGGVPLELKDGFRDWPLFHFEPPGSHDIVVLNSVHSRPEPEFAALKKAGVAAALAIPLYANERNLGLICFASSSRETIAPDESDFVTTIAQYLATALDRENTSRQLQKATELLSDHAQLLERRVQERTSRLQDTIAELETFSYTIAHDLRAPARAMSGYCEVLLQDFAESFPPRAKFVLDRIARASGRMAALTRDLLEFSRVSRREVVLAPVEIEPVIEDLLAMRSPAAREAIIVRSPLHAVLAQRELLLQVLSNLVDNAVKFVVRDTLPKITISTEVVSSHSPNTRLRSLVFSSTESAKSENEVTPSETPLPHVRIWVADEGIGIPGELHQKIFGIFERASSSDLYDGTGMGLAIVARAMQRMGGTCGVESEPLKGSRFWIELPGAN